MRHSVLHLIDTGGPGGAETIFHNLVTGLDARRWQSLAAVPVRDWLYDALEKSGVTPILLSTHGSFDVAYLRRLVRVARSGPALIHAHLLTSSVYGALAAACARIPLVCTFHGAVDVHHQDRLRNLKFRLINQAAQARLVFVSEALRRTFQASVPIDDTRAAVVYNGIDTSRFVPGADRPLRRELGLRADDVLIGAVGNVRTSKAYDVLLRTAAVLLRRDARMRIIIAGQTGGAVYDQLCALHAQLELGDRVRFLGLRADVPAVMRSLDIYLSSSSAEGFSLTTVEAMACGVPVVATRSGGPEEIITDGVNGVLVPTGAPEALADAIHRLAQDPARRGRLAAAGRETVQERFTVAAMLRNYEALYDLSLGERRHAGVAPGNDGRRLAERHELR